jgi:hypothetical protein
VRENFQTLCLLLIISYIIKSTPRGVLVVENVDGLNMETLMKDDLNASLHAIIIFEMIIEPSIVSSGGASGGGWGGYPACF